jgi:TM2 domain-containing membrane protein YozV
MKHAVVAVILSALVFPGLGQLYKREIRKGVFLILAASLLLAVLVLGFLILYSFGYAEIVAAAGTAEAVTPAQLEQLLGQTGRHPFILFTLGLLLATWVYSWADAGRAPLTPPQGSSHDRIQ